MLACVSACFRESVHVCACTFGAGLGKEVCGEAGTLKAVAVRGVGANFSGR